MQFKRGIDPRLRNAHQESALDIAVRTNKANICRLLLLHCPELALQVCYVSLRIQLPSLCRVLRIVALHNLNTATVHLHRFPFTVQLVLATRNV